MNHLEQLISSSIQLELEEKLLLGLLLMKPDLWSSVRPILTSSDESESTSNVSASSYSLDDFLYHSLVLGATGSGKTEFLITLSWWLIASGQTVVVIDPQGKLYTSLLRLCLNSGITPRIMHPQSGFITPYNPAKRFGDIGPQTDSLINLILRSSNETPQDLLPRLKRNLRAFFTVILEKGWTLLEARQLLKHKNNLHEGLEDKETEDLLDSLHALTPKEFLIQMESATNRLWEFSEQRTLGLVLGHGGSIISPPEVIESGVTLVNLEAGSRFSLEERKTLGTMLVGEIYRAGMMRFGKPCFLIADEAEIFLTPEIASAMELSRQHGLHFILAARRLGEFRDLASAVRFGTRTKFVFNQPDPEEARILVPEIFMGLAESEIKYTIPRIRTAIDDVLRYEVSMSETKNQTSGGAEARNKNSSTNDWGWKERMRSHIDEDGESHYDTWDEWVPEAISVNETTSIAQNWTTGAGVTLSVTPKWGTKHREVTEHEPVDWTLEEKIYRDAEKLLTLPTGACFVKTPHHVSFQKVLRQPLPNDPEIIELVKNLYRTLPTAESVRERIRKRKESPPPEVRRKPRNPA